MCVTGNAERPAAIVGIGASAGGIEAMKRFLAATPADTGLGYVLVMHLQPGHKSHLAQVLQAKADIQVVEAEDGQAVRPDTLHVIPPNANLTIENGVLHLQAIDAEHPYHQIDTFFRALAADQQDRSICAVLAGAGSDGSIGLRAIKEHGGLALTAQIDEPVGGQHPTSPAQDSMPRAAAATGLADHVVPVKEMPRIALAYTRHLDQLAEDIDGLQERLRANLQPICERIRERTDHDLSQYKSATLMRRIQRRMQALQIADSADYLARMDESPAEIDTLYRDILIGVTSFFRDPEAFAALEKDVIPELLDRAERTGEAVRVWVPGCGSGEEAYSLAILLCEGCAQRGKKVDIQVFGTDVDATAIRQARTGRYSSGVAEQLAPERRHRYLEHDGDGYRVVQEIRDICLFSEHDLIRHPPFSRLDLISCRNLLIYLEVDLQARLIPLFHYALRDGGYLFLGASETLGQHGDLFDPVDKKRRIFRRRDTTFKRVPEFPLGRGGRRLPHIPLRRPQDEDAQNRLTHKAERAVLDEYGPPYVILNAKREAVYLSPGAGRYLELPVGSPRCHVLDMAPAPLRSTLRNGLRALVEGPDNVVERRLQTGGYGGRPIDLSLKRIRERRGEAEMYLIVFKEIAPEVAPPAVASSGAGESSSEGNSDLERELAETRFDLQSSIEELEASNEELQSANEELLSMNEELQSGNEELESSKEELQSVNEEMETVNDELRHKIEELNRSNADLRNLIESTRIATVFLDRERRIKWFTPDARDLFNLISTDVGRRFSDLAGRLDAPPERELARVLETGTPIERQVQLTDGSASYIMRLLPYRTAEDTVDGVVLTFIDVTKLHEMTTDLASVMDLVPVGVALSRDADATRVRVNRHGQRMLGLDREEISDTDLADLIAVNEAAGAPTGLPLTAAAATASRIRETEATIKPRGDEMQRSVLLAAAPLGEVGAPGRGAIMSIVDVSELKAAQHRQRLLMRALQHRVRNMLASIRAMATDTMDASASVDEFAERFEGRLDALALTETLVSRRGGGSVDLRELIDEILLPEATHDGVTTDGPEVALEARAGQLLALALNELKTNAIKHGALFGPGGGVTVRWGVVTDENGRMVLRLRWLEPGVGELSDAPRGFGRELIEEGVPHELGGHATWQIANGNLTCIIDVPMEPHVLSVSEADDSSTRQGKEPEGL